MYYWKDDIKDADKVFGRDQGYEILLEICRNELIDDGMNPRDEGFDEAVMEEASNTIGFNAISKNSALYSLLCEWNKNRGTTLEDTVRGFYEARGYMFYVTGCNYDTCDKDLLGGAGDGQTARKFEDFIESKGL